MGKTALSFLSRVRCSRVDEEGSNVGADLCVRPWWCSGVVPAVGAGFHACPWEEGVWCIRRGDGMPRP